jgi:hypothetical protein
MASSNEKNKKKSRKLSMPIRIASLNAFTVVALQSYKKGIGLIRF